MHQISAKKYKLTYDWMGKVNCARNLKLTLRKSRNSTTDNPWEWDAKNSLKFLDTMNHLISARRPDVEIVSRKREPAK